MANSLLLCCQEAAGDRTQDALRGFTAISSDTPTTAAEWELNGRDGSEAGLRISKEGINANLSLRGQRVECGHWGDVQGPQTVKWREVLTILGRGHNVPSASVAH